MKKTVSVVGYEFDSLPAHVRITGRGSGARLRVAVQRAIADMFRQRGLRHKQTGSFKISVVVIAEREPDASSNVGEIVTEHLKKAGNCGDCLMEHASIVPLRADRTCACCESGHKLRARGTAVRA